MNELSIRQPWASLIIVGVESTYKDVENRTWPTTYRGRLYIHAGQAFDHAGYQTIQRRFPHLPLPPIDSFPRGGILGTIEIYDCVTMSLSLWFQGPYGFLLRNPQPCPFTPLKGQLRFFQVDLSSL